MLDYAREFLADNWGWLFVVDGAIVVFVALVVKAVSERAD